MKILRVIAVFALILCAGISWSEGTGSMSPELQKLYRTLSTSPSYELKRDAVKKMHKLYDESKDFIFIETAIDLLEHSFDVEDFNEEDQKMYYNDKIAGELIKLLNKSRHPKSFIVLIQIVTKRNHTDRTIMEAWKAMQNLDWSLAPGQY